MTYNVGQLLEYEDRMGGWHLVMVTAIDWPKFSYRNLDMLAGGSTGHDDATFRPVTEERLIALTERKPMTAKQLIAEHDLSVKETDPLSGHGAAPSGSADGGTNG